MEHARMSAEGEGVFAEAEEQVRQSVQGFSAAVLRTARRRRGWSQADLAAAAGVAEGSIAAWEKGTTRPTVSRLRLVARALDLQVADFLSSPRASSTLAQLRGAAGLTLLEAANAAGISKSTLYRAERGYAMLTDARAAALAALYAATEAEVSAASAASIRELQRRTRPTDSE